MFIVDLRTRARIALGHDAMAALGVDSLRLAILETQRTATNGRTDQCWDKMTLYSDVERLQTQRQREAAGCPVIAPGGGGMGSRGDAPWWAPLAMGAVVAATAATVSALRCAGQRRKKRGAENV